MGELSVLSSRRKLFTKNLLFWIITTKLLVIMRNCTKPFKCADFRKVFISIGIICQIWGPRYRSSPPEVILGKNVLKICSKFTGEQPCQSVISIKFQSNFIEITLWHEHSPVNLLHIFRTSFPKNTCGGLLRKVRDALFTKKYTMNLGS